MTLLDQIKDILKRLLENYELPGNIQRKIVEMLERIGSIQEEPEVIFLARLLTEFIEIIGKRMPPVIKTFIKLYAQALNDAINTTVYLACIRYWMMRQMGASHDDAAYATQLTEENKVWCRLVWQLHHLPPANPDLEPPAADVADTSELEPPEEANWLPEKPETSRIFVHEDFKDCCETGGKDEPITIDWGTLRVKEVGGNGFLVGTFSFEHPCGIAHYLIRLRIPPGIDNFFQIGIGTISTYLSISQSENIIKVKVKKPIQLYTSDSSPVRPRVLRILAISNCFTKPDVGLSELTITESS